MSAANSLSIVIKQSSISDSEINGRNITHTIIMTSNALLHVKTTIPECLINLT